MAKCVYVVCLWLVASSLMQGQTGPVPVSGTIEPDLLLAANASIVDVNELRVLFVTRADYASSFEVLASRIGERLDRAGIKRVKRDTGSVPRLVVCIEGVPIPECEKCVYRVQTALHRPVTLPGDPQANLQAEVWRLMPVGGVIARSRVGQAVEAAVEAQVSAFIGATKAARTSLAKSGATTQRSAGLAQAGARTPQAASKYPFVASRSSSVFHRPACRWAQNIADNNLVGYQTREEALQAGKRPCRTCKP